MLFFRPFIYMEEVSFMATQIASTPVVRGKEAVKTLPKQAPKH